MDVDGIKEEIKKSNYDFLREDTNLGNNIILLTLGGSYAYGTNNENSDIDIRGIATNSKQNLLTMKDFEQVVETNTDTTVYSLDKIIKLLCSCNPNTIEILGCRPEHYLYLTDAGKILIENRHAFLSKKAIHSFGGYSHSQLRRLENRAARLVSQSQMEKHILQSITHASVEFKKNYFQFPEDAINLYIDKAVNEGYDTEIFMDVVMNHYPLRDFKDLWSEMHSIVKSYSKIGKRNEKAIEHDKLGKHMCHLVRLYFMCFDILENEEIITYREKEHDLLMDIRNGKYLDDNRQPTKEFYDIVDELEAKLVRLSNTTELPDNADMTKINKILAKINESVVLS